MKIELFSKAICPKCGALKGFLQSEGFEYIELRVDEDDKALARVKEMGLQSLPIIVVDENDDDPIVGLDMPRLEQLINK